VSTKVDKDQDPQSCERRVQRSEVRIGTSG
jgi:hypothetical protein